MAFVRNLRVLRCNLKLKGNVRAISASCQQSELFDKNILDKTTTGKQCKSKNSNYQKFLLYTQSSIGSVRLYSDSQDQWVHGPQNIHYEELLKLVKSGKIQLFDVREPGECETTGMIEGAVNIPLAEVGQAFRLSPEEFKEKYGVRQPNKDDTDVVFHCKGGIRSAGALAMTQANGYKNCRHFPGGFDEWEEKQNVN